MSSLIKHSITFPEEDILRGGGTESSDSGKGMVQTLFPSPEGLIDFIGVSPKSEMFTLQ